METEELLHPLLRIGVFIVHFLAIHPFQDGNGRLSRILTTLLLLRSGYSYVPYASLEAIVEQNKETYYLALRRTQTTLRQETPDWESWLHFFCAASIVRPFDCKRGWLQRLVRPRPSRPSQPNWQSCSRRRKTGRSQRLRGNLKPALTL